MTSPRATTRVKGGVPAHDPAEAVGAPLTRVVGTSQVIRDGARPLDWVVYASLVTIPAGAAVVSCT